jgi:hypothetical protein
MSSIKTAAVKQDQLNRAMPAMRDAALGDVVVDLIATVNALQADLTALRTRYNAALAKLDADGGVTDTNYVALQAMPALTAGTVAVLADR